MELCYNTNEDTRAMILVQMFFHGKSVTHSHFDVYLKPMMDNIGKTEKQMFTDLHITYMV